MKSTWTTAELTSDGTRRDELSRRVGMGELVRIRRGAYAMPAKLTARDAHLRLLDSSLAALGPDAVVSHASAAVLHGLPVEPHLLETAWVTRTGSSHGRRTATLRQFGATLGTDDVQLADDRSCTTPLRTAADLACSASYPWAVAAWDAVLHLGLATADEVKTAAANLGRRPGAARARAAAAFADHRAESVLESISRVQIARLGLPRPELQYPIVADGVIVGFGDFAWPEFRCIGESDGLTKYRDQAFDDRTGHEVIRDEKRREERFRELGWWMCRWDWDVAHHPANLERRIRAGLSHGADLRPVRRGPDLGVADEPRRRAS